MGLINRMAAGANALAAVEAELIAKITALDPAAVRLTKETHRASANMPLADALTMGKQLNALLMASGRIDEASTAFAARRRK
jgi:enoyl-CoA hydratase/carnithine racemase